jgi:adenylylsulfate kinase-like enzyme
MIVWINGPYGGGKTTLVEELVRRRPDAVMLDPEYLGYWLRQTVAVPTDNVQDLRGWREIVVASVLSVHRHHAQLLLVPTTLINPAHRDEVLGALHTAGAELLEVFLEVSAEELRRRIDSRVLYTDDPARDADARNWCLSQIPEGITAARQVGQSTMVLAATTASPSELALAVLERLDARS